MRSRSGRADDRPTRAVRPRIRRSAPLVCGVLVAFAFSAGSRLAADERIVGLVDGKEIDVTGRVVVEAQDGGVLLETPDGRQWAFDATEITSRTDDGRPFAPLDGDGLEREMLRRLGSGFRVHRTQHYVIAYETSEAFAIWTGALFERLLRGFETYWRQRDIELREPEFPLPVVILGSKARFDDFSSDVFGGNPGSVVAYYHLLHNEVVLYDITEADQESSDGRRRSNADQINALLSQPRAYALVATIVHEATHQVAYNLGMQRRLADVPMWINEGIATFFETPDLRSRSGWRGIGAINTIRMPQLQQDLARRQAGAIERLLDGDERFRNGETILEAYAESWGLVYYLAKVRKEDFAAYLRDLQQLEPLGQESPEERIALFRRHFGDDLEGLDREFRRYMERQR